MSIFSVSSILFALMQALLSGLSILVFQPFGPGNLANTLVSFGTPILVLIVSFAVRPRGIVAAATACSIIAFFFLFSTWVQAMGIVDGIVYLEFFYLLPGALVGALVAGGLLRKQSRMAAFALTVASVATGIAINLALLKIVTPYGL